MDSFGPSDLFQFLTRFMQGIAGQFDRLNTLLERNIQRQDQQQALLQQLVNNQQQQPRQQPQQQAEISAIERELIESVQNLTDSHETTAPDVGADPLLGGAADDHAPEDDYSELIPENFEPPTFQDLPSPDPIDTILHSFEEQSFEEQNHHNTVVLQQNHSKRPLADFFDEDGEFLPRQILPKPPGRKRSRTTALESPPPRPARPVVMSGGGVSGSVGDDPTIASTSRRQPGTPDHPGAPQTIFQFTDMRHLDPKHNKRFNIKEYDIIMTVKHNLREFSGGIMQVGAELDAFYEDLMRKYLDDLQSPEDYYSFEFRFTRGYPINIFGKKKAFDPMQLTNALYKISQSNTACMMDGKAGIRIGLIPASHSGTGDSVGYRGLTAAQLAKQCRNIITIRNKDNICGWRALVVSLWRAENPQPSKLPQLAPLQQENGRRYCNNRLGDDYNRRWKCISNSHLKRQKEMAEQLMEDLGVEPGTPMTSDHYPVIAQYLELRDIQFIVMSTVGPSPLYRTEYKEKFVGLLYTPGQAEYDPGHYNVFLKLSAVYTTRLACRKCWRVSVHHLWYDHKCFVCDLCLTKHAPDDGSGDRNIKCNDCCRTFMNQTCYDNHKNGTDYTNRLKRSTTCKKIRYCESCEVEYQSRAGTHVCGTFKCHHCSEKYTETPHYCDIKPLNKEALQKQDSKLKIIVCFDIESVIDSTQGHVHTAVLLKAQTTCHECWDDTTNSYKKNEDGLDIDCPNCQEHYLSFEGPGCVTSFVNYIFDVLAPMKMRKNQKKLKCHEIYVYAHNNRAYDGIFVFAEVLKTNRLKPTVIANGHKIMKLKVGSVRFLDSLYLFPMGLAALPTAFGIQDKSKGRFPYTLLTMDNYNSDEPQPLPPLSAFEPDQLKEKDKKGLCAWYNARQALNEPYIFKHELHTYCANDVEILLKVLMKFRQLFKSITGIDPLTRQFTLASIAMESFRANHLGEYKVGVTPIASYNSRGASITGDIWLDWIEKTRGITLAREYCVYGVYYADAMHVESKTVFEFLGCFWHGCRKCFADQDLTSPKQGVPYRTLNEAVSEKRRYYTKHGLHCEFLWECEFKQMRDEDPGLNQFFLERKEHYKTIDKIGPIQLRDALKGGRTNNIKFLHEATEEESIRYLDVCSLYPSQLKRQKFPLGHPIRITGEFDMTIQSYFGYVQCAVDPPPKLRFGVLPVTVNGKLTFPLCMVCAETQATTFCRHSVEDRRMTGTWTTIELNHALNRGYRIHKIYTVLHWPESTDNLFTGYIDTWLKHKIHASGFPEDVVTLGDQLEYIREYEEREGVKLELDKMVYNPGLRTLAKLMLNSLWGKLAQRTNLPTTSIVTNQADMRKILLDPEKVVESLYCPTDNHMIIVWRLASEEHARPGITSLAAAGFVTAYGRVTLLNHMERIEQVRMGRVLYFDTDSVIFVERPGDPIVPTGNFLGDLTDEIALGWRCDTFACGGPKNYLLRLRKGDETKIILKAKGLVLTSEACQIVHFDSMIDMCKKFIAGETIEYRIPQFRIHSNYKTGHVYSCYNLKKYRVSGDKRLKLQGDNDTWPYGFVDCVQCGTSLTCKCSPQ